MEDQNEAQPEVAEEAAEAVEGESTVEEAPVDESVSELDLEAQAEEEEAAGKGEEEEPEPVPAGELVPGVDYSNPFGLSSTEGEQMIVDNPKLIKDFDKMVVERKFQHPDGLRRKLTELGYLA